MEVGHRVRQQRRVQIEHDGEDKSGGGIGDGGKDQAQRAVQDERGGDRPLDVFRLLRPEHL